jgi:uncharacterized membrane-anchored protein YhcB (DUF1043 family)
MFWILAPIALIGMAVSAIMSSVSEDEKTARKRWQEKRVDAEKTIEEHRQNIEKHISKAQESFDFSFLCDLHYSSHRVGVNAYSLLGDARTSLKSISTIIGKTSGKKAEIKELLSGASGEVRKELLGEIRELNSFKSNLLLDYKTVKQQSETLLMEVNRLNAQTRNLKHTIRDRCGDRGLDWYNRLEQRTSERKKA